MQMPRHIGTCFRFYTQMQVEKKTKAFAYKIYSHFTQHCMFCQLSKAQTIYFLSLYRCTEVPHFHSFH